MPMNLVSCMSDFNRSVPEQTDRLAELVSEIGKVIGVDFAYLSQLNIRIMKSGISVTYKTEPQTVFFANDWHGK